MRLRRAFFLLLLLSAAAAILFFIFRRDTQAAFGPALALCPGPDRYGYTCESGPAFAYIDATQDTQLYTDDGVITLELPFPFTFYGTTYTRLNASSNGNIQFDTSSARFLNECLTDAPAAQMGDMIAPFWDDLDLRLEGFLETETVGETPNRIFVIEWDDVPRFSDADDKVTFAVQLWEATHDIVVLYEDVTLFEGANGRSATIGIQSEVQGLALQFGCDQPVVADVSAFRFRHPDTPNADVGRETAALPASVGPAPLVAKGDLAELLDQLNWRGRSALPDLARTWLNRRQPLRGSWEWADLTGDGHQELVLLQQGVGRPPAQAAIAVLGLDEDGRYALRLAHDLTTRQTPGPQLLLERLADLTGDGLVDALVLDTAGGYGYVLAGGSSLALRPLPGQCRGSVAIRAGAGTGPAVIVRDGCLLDGRPASGRLPVAWDGQGFTAVATP